MQVQDEVCRSDGVTYFNGWRHARHPRNKLRGCRTCRACPRGCYEESAAVEFFGFIAHPNWSEQTRWGDVTMLWKQTLRWSLVSATTRHAVTSASRWLTWPVVSCATVTSTDVQPAATAIASRPTCCPLDAVVGVRAVRLQLAHSRRMIEGVSINEEACKLGR